MMRNAMILCLVALLAGDIAASPRDAQAVAMADISRLPAGDRPYIRYVYRQDGEIKSARMTSLTVNIISRSAVIAKPDVPAPILSRIDLRRYARTEADLIELAALWESFAFDPTFSRIVTADTIKFLLRAGEVFSDVVEVGDRRLLVKTAPYKVDGETFEARWVDAIRFPGPHLDQRTYADLLRMTGSEAPVVESRYFAFRALSTIKDKGLYATLYGGLYYELAGFKTSKTKGITDEDLLFESLGVGDTKLGLTAEVLYERVASDRKAAMFRSKVTKKPRAIDELKILQGVDSAVAWVTHDPRDQDIDIGSNTVMNLLKLSPNPDRKNKATSEAREIIFTRRNGLHGFVLVNGAGALAEAAPDDVVVDHLIPAPFTRRLQGAISCLRCHGVDGSDGIKPFTNDVQALVKKGGVDILGDVSDASKSQQEVIDRLAGQFGRSSDTSIFRARQDYIAAILRATGPWREDGDQTGVGKLAADAYAEMWQQYWYDDVDAARAVKDLGYPSMPNEAATVLFWVLMGNPGRLTSSPGWFANAQQVVPVAEDPRLGQIKAGLAISRSDWALVYSTAAWRAQITESRWAPKKEPRIEGEKK